MENDRAAALRLARGLFDPGWYSSSTPTPDAAFREFIALGPRADSDPHPLFSLDYYLSQAPALGLGDESPLVHFVREGWRAGLSPHPLFDTAHYTRLYLDHLAPGEDPLTHFLRHGCQYNFSPTPWFSPAYYNECYPDVAASGINLLAHFAVFGGSELRRPHPEFDPVVHARRNGLDGEGHPLIDFLRRLKVARSTNEPPAEPVYSIVIVNFNKPLMTTQVVVEILADPDLAERAEVIVVDNGSDPANYALLRTQIPAAARVLRLDVNRFFGEGNNLGAELARGQYLIFLNNDAFVDAASIEALRRVAAERPDCGAVGPRFVYPDGRVQEAGAMMSACGIAVQRGKFLSPALDIYAQTEPVDYVSAACMLLPRETFDEVGGFDLIWDPAYYEDADIGLKLRLAGKRVYYCPEANVTHIENGTSGDERLGLRMEGSVEVNREKFIGRWAGYVRAGYDPAHASITLPPRESRPRFRPTAVLYTPYPLYPGGGERYLLTIAEALASNYDVLLATPERYSIWRIRTLARDLRLDLSHVIPIAERELDRHRDCALFVCMGNELFPPVPAQGRRALYVCQFPFPMPAAHLTSMSRNLAGYEGVIVYSQYSARNLRAEAARYGERLPPLTIVSPPVDPIRPGPEQVVGGRIMHVGRFTTAGHSKRQDLIVEAFGELHARFPDAELHLAGSVPADPLSRDYVTALRRAAMNLPVTLHLNASPEQLDALYRSSEVYWHATGFGQGAARPEMQEHFGITIIEAMSAGCIPVVYDGGGPPEFVEPGVSGELFRTRDELVEKTLALFALSDDVRELRVAAAKKVAERFGVDGFARTIRQIAAGVSASNGEVGPVPAALDREPAT